MKVLDKPMVLPVESQWLQGNDERKNQKAVLSEKKK